MRILNHKLKREKIEKYSEINSDLSGKVSVLKNSHYRIIKDTTVGGDAPKELLRVYKFKKGLKQISKPNSWPIYIVKTGHKWYPYESVTEYLLNRIGKALDLNMAESELNLVNGQLRFFSKLFRSERKQILEHGAELYWGYLGDKDFVEQVEKENKAREFFTIKFTKDTLHHIYPHQGEDIFLEFVRMIIFDAIIGNNDRHFFNWGILKHIENKHQPKFSPIYDTARALFWNRSEDYIRDQIKNEATLQKVLLSYINKSKPKIGIEKNSNCNHFDIIDLLNSNKIYGTKDLLFSYINIENQKICNEV